MSEESARRRRFLTLAEIVAVAGVVIAALTLWNTWQDRRDARAEREAERQAATAASFTERQHVGLIADGKGGDVLSIKGSDCTLQSLDVSFPTALQVPPQRMIVDHRLLARWIERPLLDATAKKSDTRTGRLPVLIQSRCEAADGPRDETAVYVLAWRIHSRPLRGRALDLVGIVERQPARTAGAGQARVDALWSADKPG